MILRDFDPQLDYPALTVIRCRAEPDYPILEKTLRSRDASRPEYCRYARFVVAEGDTVIGAGEYNHFVGVSQITRSMTPHPNMLDVGLTEVRREWRNKKIVFALKLTTIEFARTQGAVMLHTHNASDNVPILALSEQLGFIRKPWHVHLLRTFP